MHPAFIRDFQGTASTSAGKRIISHPWFTNMGNNMSFNRCNLFYYKKLVKQGITGIRLPKEL